jgi:SAM-dependent methyltransferase
MPARHAIHFPKQPSHDLGQNEAFFFLTEDGETRRIKFHDYDAIYNRPGLYEQLFYERLRCQSPEVVVSRLTGAMEHAGESIQTQRILDLGAGNGIGAQELDRIGASRVVGLDIIPEARTAALRDRPGAYDEYLVADMTALSEEQRSSLAEWQLSAVTCVAALGFDDIPAPAFVTAMEVISEDGWIAFNIKTDFLKGGSGGDFADFVKLLLAEDLIELHHIERYRHRLSIDGDWLEYYVIVGRKRGALPKKVRETFG